MPESGDSLHGSSWPLVASQQTTCLSEQLVASQTTVVLGSCELCSASARDENLHKVGTRVASVPTAVLLFCRPAVLPMSAKAKGGKAKSKARSSRRTGKAKASWRMKGPIGVVYSRTSSKGSKVAGSKDRQSKQSSEAAKRAKVNVVKPVSEVVSGSLPLERRDALRELLHGKIQGMQALDPKKIKICVESARAVAARDRAAVEAKPRNRCRDHSS